MINENSLKVPPFVILNSVLSRLKQDVVTITSRGVQPGLVSLYSSQHEYDASNPAIIRRLSFSFSGNVSGRCKWEFQDQMRSESNMDWDRDVAKTIQKMNEKYRVSASAIIDVSDRRRLRSRPRDSVDQPPAELFPQQSGHSHRRRRHLPERRDIRGEEPTNQHRRGLLLPRSLPRVPRALHQPRGFHHHVGIPRAVSCDDVLLRSREKLPPSNAAFVPSVCSPSRSERRCGGV